MISGTLKLSVPGLLSFFTEDWHQERLRQSGDWFYINGDDGGDGDDGDHLQPAHQPW